ncbi:MAG: UDP-2,3-diacylglucosamine diphosphatase [Moraxellaceae bacterium]|jgi:UDP-2,3-diacylglucosamine hydrolase|nr:UDP-2,3-diacylglucosamine diphosphatase [Moraxellaceae bacterium]
MSRTYFISDLHLSPDLPRVTAGFLALLEHIRGATALYVLGDLFEAWVGDDHRDDYNNRVIEAFRALADSGTKLYFVHGNRDFLLGTGFAGATGGTLLPDSAVVELDGQRVLLMHGDQLCTRDEKFMAFRAQSRDPAWQQMMLANPLEQRLMIAGMWRMQSKANNSNKPENIMDVTPEEVTRVLQESDAATLLHGHTHRPQVHELDVAGRPARRMVLGDWREDSGEAVIGVADDDGLRLETWRF